MHHPIINQAVPVLAGVMLLSTSALGAQPQDENADTGDDGTVQSLRTEPGSLSFSAYIEGTIFAETDLDGTIGTIEYTKIKSGIKATQKIGDAGHLSIGFDAGLINYDIKPSATSVGGDVASIGAGFDDMTTLSLVATYTDRTDDGSSWYIGGGVLSGSERDAEFGDSIDGMVTSGFLYKFSSSLELGLGVYVRTRLDDDVLIVPLPLIKYKIDERWSLASQGAGIAINYKASDALTYGLSGEFVSETFRLDSTHAFAPKGMAIHRGFPIAFFANYAPNDTIVISAKLGSVVGAELEILNSSGSSIASQDIDTGIFGSLMVSFKF